MTAAEFLAEAAHAFAAHGIDTASRDFRAALNNLAMAVAAETEPEVPVEAPTQFAQELEARAMERAVRYGVDLGGAPVVIVAAK